VACVLIETTFTQGTLLTAIARVCCPVVHRSKLFTSLSDTMVTTINDQGCTDRHRTEPTPMKIILNGSGATLNVHQHNIKLILRTEGLRQGKERNGQGGMGRRRTPKHKSTTTPMTKIHKHIVVTEDYV